MSKAQSREVVGFNMEECKSNSNSESKVGLVNAPKLCNELVSCWDTITRTAAARGVDPQYPSLFRGKELDESPSALPQPLFMASCRRWENIIISWWARAKTAWIFSWSLAACSSSAAASLREELLLGSASAWEVRTPWLKLSGWSGGVTAARWRRSSASSVVWRNASFN